MVVIDSIWAGQLLVTDKLDCSASSSPITYSHNGVGVLDEVLGKINARNIEIRVSDATSGAAGVTCVTLAVATLLTVAPASHAFAGGEAGLSRVAFKYGRRASCREVATDLAVAPACHAHIRHAGI